VLENEDQAPAGLLGDWLRARGLDAETVAVWERGVPADPAEFAWIASLGAANSVTDPEPAWIGAEIEFIRRAVKADVPVLGLCFGGQALSVALGGEISPVDAPSIGWFDVDTHAPDLLPGGPWMHFNVERFSVPPGAEAVARSAAGVVAFANGPHLGTQFHPEVTPPIVDDWLRSEAAVVTRLGVDPDAVRAQSEANATAAVERAFALFDGWLARGDGARR